MKASKDIYSVCKTGLTRLDLVDFEHVIKDEFSKFISFDSYSLYFPKSLPREGQVLAEGTTPRYIKDEKRLMLPLVADGDLLGHFIAKGVRLNAPKTLPKYLMLLACSVLEKLMLYKAAITDPLTGIFTRDYFLTRLAKEIELVKSGITPDKSQLGDGGIHEFSGCMGIVFMDLDRFQWINDTYGYAFGDEVLNNLGQTIKKAAPPTAVLSRYGEDKFALLVPDATAKTCFQLAELLREKVSRKLYTSPVSEDRVKITASVGYANYPQDFPGYQLVKNSREQARMAVRKSIKAMGVAKDHGRNQVFGFSDIVSKGGRILEILPMDRVSVNLGKSVDAFEGMRFLIFSPKFEGPAEARLTEDERLHGKYPSMHKGELVLAEVQEDMAFAEILYKSDPNWHVEPGDRLALIKESESLLNGNAAHGVKTEAAQKDIITGLYSYKDFIRQWASFRQSESEYGMAMIRVTEHPKARPGQFQSKMDIWMRDLAALTAEVFKDKAMGARHSLNTLVFAFKGMNKDDIRKLTQDFMQKAAQNLDMDIAVGVGFHPCLAYNPSDTLDNTRKALEHAQLLPKPRLAVFDSISLNVSADRIFVEGDVFEAIQEFKNSLLMDENNILAHNSLGVCYAGLGKLEQAVFHFTKSLGIDPKDASAWYNLGRARQRMREHVLAGEAFEKCLEIDKNNAYCLLRLGNLAERNNDLKKAGKFYEAARKTPEGEPLAMCHLARLAIKNNDNDTAREYLHQALIHNHKDAYSLNLLATLYLDSGEDPEIAEALSRQSAALKPEKKEYWRTLARALEAQGKDEELSEIVSRGM